MAWGIDPPCILEMPARIISLEQRDGRLFAALETGLTVDVTDWFAERDGDARETAEADTVAKVVVWLRTMRGGAKMPEPLADQIEQGAWKP